MSAFGRKSGPGGMAPGNGARPAFGVAKPMRGGSPTPSGESSRGAIPGGEQFPPIPEDGTGIDQPMGNNRNADAMSRLSDRANAISEGDNEPTGFEASVHKIKEQVLPRLLERVDPEAAATLSKDELSE